MNKLNSKQQKILKEKLVVMKNLKKKLENTEIEQMLKKYFTNEEIRMLGACVQMQILIQEDYINNASTSKIFS